MSSSAAEVEVASSLYTNTTNCNPAFLPSSQSYEKDYYLISSLVLYGSPTSFSELCLKFCSASLCANLYLVYVSKVVLVCFLTFGFSGEVQQTDILVQQKDLPEGWTRGGSHPTRYVMGLDTGKCGTGTATAFIHSTSLSLLPNGQLGFGTVCQRFYPKSFLGKRVKLSGHLCWNLAGPESWTGMWVKVDLITIKNTPRTFHLDNMADRKLTGSSEGNWVLVEIITDIPYNVEGLSFGFLLVGIGIIWASDFKFEVLGNIAESQRMELKQPTDSITQELRENLRKLSLGPPSKPTSNHPDPQVQIGSQ